MAGLIRGLGGLRWDVLGALLVGWLLLAGTAHATPLQLWFEKYEASDALARLADAFAAESGVKVTTVYMPNGELRNGIMRAVAQGNAPDMVLVPSDFLGSRAAMQLSLVPPESVDVLDTDAVATVRTRDGLFGVPLLYGNHLMLMYNRSLTTMVPRDWQSLLAQRTAIEAAGNKLIGWKVAEMYWLIPFLTAFDADPVVNGELRLDTPQMVQALTFYKSQLDGGVISPRCTYECSHERFGAGEFAYAINGDWALEPLSVELGDKLGVAVLPDINGHPMRPYAGSITLAFPSRGLSGPNANALKDFVTFMTRPESQKRLHEAAGLLPARADMLGALRASATGNAQARLAQLSRCLPMPPEPEMAAAWVGLAKGYSLFMRGKADAATAARLMQQVAEQELQRLQTNFSQ